MNGIIGTIYTLFSSSSRRSEKLKHIIQTTSFDKTLEVNEVKKKKLKKIMRAEQLDALLTFKELYVYIVSTLKDLENDTNRETSTKATLYSSTITKPDFLIALVRYIFFLYFSTEQTFTE